MKKKKQMEKIRVDRKIVEGLREGQSVTGLTKLTKKGKGYVIKIRDLALEYGFIEPALENEKTFQPGLKVIPPYPESLFPLKDGRSEKAIETDAFLFPQKQWITERLQAGWSPQTIFEELTVPLPRSSFYRYLHRNNLMRINSFKNVQEIIHDPGECLQVDWGKLFDVQSETGKRRIIWCFIGTLGHSRYRMVRIVECCDYKTTIEALISMLEEVGGVPRKITSDNPKVFVKEASYYEPTINPAYERFSGYYGFKIEALPPRAPSLKGKVERVVDPIRRLFESYDIEKYTLESAQSHINKKLELHNERRHSVHGLRPLDVFINDEASLLKPLPKLPYEIETITYPIIREDGYVFFDKKYYRVDQSLKKEIAMIIANQTHLSIYCKGKLLECYERIKTPFQTRACKDHYKEPWEKTLKDHDHYIRRAHCIGEDVGRFINIILARGEGFLDNRVVWGILSLDKKYQRGDINNACRTAIELSQINFGAVRKLLTVMAKAKDQKIKNEYGESFKTEKGKFTRPMSEYKNHLRLVINNQIQGEVQ